MSFLVLGFRNRVGRSVLWLVTRLLRQGAFGQLNEKITKMRLVALHEVRRDHLPWEPDGTKRKSCGVCFNSVAGW
jgi:hypothetical protein